MRSRLPATVVLATVVVSICAVVTASPAAAGVVCAGNASTAPDGRLKEMGEPFFGEGLYPQAINQEVVGVGQQATFKLRWENVSGSTRTIRVARAEPEHDPAFSVRYLVAGVNVNDRMKHGNGLRFVGIAPGRSTPTLEVVVKNRSSIGGEITEQVRGRYGSTPLTTCDAVVVQVANPV